VLLPRQSRALQSSSRKHPENHIAPFNASDLPSSRAAKAWSDSIKSAMSPSSSSKMLMEHTCSALIRYRTQNFIKQAEAASELLNRALLNDGQYINVKWTHKEYNDRPFVEKDSFASSYRHNAPLDGSSEYCIVLQETEPKLSGVLGMAAECGYCTSNWNVAYVSESVDDSLSAFVILHEIGHLFCAKHSNHGVMHRVTGTGNTLSGTSAKELYDGLVRTNWGGSTCMPSMNVSAHRRHCHDSSCSHHPDHDDAYSTAGAIIFFSLFGFLILSAAWMASLVW